MKESSKGFRISKNYDNNNNKLDKSTFYSEKEKDYNNRSERSADKNTSHTDHFNINNKEYKQIFRLV
jgi:hypothetical protein